MGYRVRNVRGMNWIESIGGGGGILVEGSERWISIFVGLRKGF